MVDLATLKLSTVASAYTAFWLPGRDQIVYVTPQGLAPFPGGQRKHNVWEPQLMAFDPVKGTPTAVTSGLTNNMDASWCGARRGAHDLAMIPPIAANATYPKAAQRSSKRR